MLALTTPSHIAILGAGLMGREGCADTKPSFVLLLSGKGKDARLCWRSPKFARGYLHCSAADVDGDGTRELIVCTGRWCEGKGQVFVCRPAAVPPEKPPATTGPSSPPGPWRPPAR